MFAARRTTLTAGFLCLAFLPACLAFAFAGPGRTHAKKPTPKKAAPKGKVMTQPQASEKATFALPGGAVVVTVADLAALKTVVLASLRASKEPKPEQLEAELAPAEPDIDEDGVCRLGPWILQAKDGELRLTHHPERAPVMYLHYAVVARKEGRWSVTRWGVERVHAR